MAKAFAGAWLGAHQTAIQSMAERIYRLESHPGHGRVGTLRIADPSDRDLLVAWFHAVPPRGP